MVYKHAVVAAFMLRVVKMRLKEEVGGSALKGTATLMITMFYMKELNKP